MKNDDTTNEGCCHEKMIFKNHHNHNHGGSGAIYGLGVVGALFYFLQSAHTFVAIITGIAKALFWPAIFRLS